MKRSIGTPCHGALSFSLRTSAARLASLARAASMSLSHRAVPGSSGSRSVHLFGILADPVAPGRGPIELSCPGVGLGNPVVTESVSGSLNVSIVEALLSGEVDVRLAWLPIIGQAGGAVSARARLLPGSIPVEIGSFRFGGLCVRCLGQRVRCRGHRVRSPGHRVRCRWWRRRCFTGLRVRFRRQAQAVALAPASRPAGDQPGRFECVQMPTHRALVHLGLNRDGLNRGERISAGLVVVMVGERQKHELRHGRADTLPERPGHGAHAHGAATPESGLDNALNSSRESMTPFGAVGQSKALISLVNPTPVGVTTYFKQHIDFIHLVLKHGLSSPHSTRHDGHCGCH